jgi:uncharacterized membrane protein
VLLSAAALLAQAAGVAAAKAAAAADDDVEEVEDVAVVPAAANPAQAEADARRGGWADVIGRFHNAVVHVPIGWLLMVLVLDLLALVAGRRELEAAGLWALGGTLASFVPGIATGLLREDFVAQTPDVQGLVGTHQALILAAAGVATAAFAWRLAFRRDLAGARKGAYLALIAVAAALVAVGGHWGGRVAWGRDYLPF